MSDLNLDGVVPTSFIELIINYIIYMRTIFLMFLVFITTFLHQVYIDPNNAQGINFIKKKFLSYGFL